MKFQITGKLHKTFDTENKSETFRVRDFVIEVADGKYPQMVKFQLTQDKCEAVDAHQEGDEITVHFDLRGREWNGKYFTNLSAWLIESAAKGEGESAGNNTPPPAHMPPSDADYSNTNTSNEFDDDIPF